MLCCAVRNGDGALLYFTYFADSDNVLKLTYPVQRCSRLRAVGDCVLGCCPIKDILIFKESNVKRSNSVDFCSNFQLFSVSFTEESLQYVLCEGCPAEILKDQPYIHHRKGPCRGE